MFFRARVTLFPVAAALLSIRLGAQSQLAGTAGGGGLHMMNTDLAVLEAQDVRKDLPCTVTPSKPVLGFDLRFHAGYEVSRSAQGALRERKQADDPVPGHVD